MAMHLRPACRTTSKAFSKFFSHRVLLSSKATSTVDFGFEEVPYEDKKERVRGVFSSVASNYDLMNDAMSGGLHRLWKDDFVVAAGLESASAAKQPPPAILDVAGGTGDIAFRFVRALQKGWSWEEIETTLLQCKQPLKGEDRGSTAKPSLITVCDINAEMLEVGRQRSLKKFPSQIHSNMTWVQGDAENLPFESNSFDLYTISFGLRNVTNRQKALEEAHRVLRPGGRFMCLEFSQVEIPVLKQIYDTYSFNIIPEMGQALAGDRESYQYLVESIRMFPRKEELQNHMDETGFKYTNFLSYTFGAVALHSGFKF